MRAITEILAQPRRRMRHLELGLAGALLCSCGPPHSPISMSDASEPGATPPLSSTTPAAGSTVAAPVNELNFIFDPPARLEEVTVAGPDGVMPTMITSVGEVPRYSIPLSGLGPGDYTVSWSATVNGQAHEGSFGFRVQ